MAGDDGVDIDQLLQQAEYQDLYSLLSLPRDATAEQIKKQYFRLIRTFHPDKQADAAKKGEANDMFAALTQAYEILSDAERRQVYDEYGIQGIISGWELAKHMGDANVWEEVMKKGRQSKAKETATSSSTSVDIFLDSSTLYDRWWLAKEEPYQGLELTCVAINHTVKIPTSEKGKVSITASTATSSSGMYPDGRAATYAQVGYEHNVSNSTLALVQMATNTRNHSVVGTLVKQLNPDHVGIMRASYAGRGKMGLALELDTTISETWKTHITLAAGGHNNSVTLKATRSIDDSSELAVSVTTGDRLSYAEIDAWKAVTETVGIKLTVSSLGRCSVGATNKVSPSTKVGFDVGMDLSGGIGMDLTFSYYKHVLRIPVIVCNEMSGVAALTAVAFPVAFYSLFRLLVVNPIASIAASRELKELHKKQALATAANKKRAARDVSLMKETVERKLKHELRVRGGGLVIVNATYGNLRKKSGAGVGESVISVTAQLQFQVEDSKLELVTKETKSSLLGFYDPCIGEEKWLHVVYRFKGKLHEVTVSDTDSLRIPQRSHVRR